MPEQFERIGVQAIWEGSSFEKGANAYLRTLVELNRQTLKWAEVGARASIEQIRQFDQATLASNAYAKATVNLGRTWDDAGRRSRGYIKSISGIYATLRLLPQVASDFGHAMEDAASGRAIKQAFETLSNTVGVNGRKIVQEMQRTSKGTINEIELMRIANRALIAGGEEFAEAMPKLLEIARAASVATGKEVTTVLDALVTGIARSSVKLIDNAEVYLKLGPVVEKYAETTGRTVDELDAQERQLVVLNAVLRQGDDLIRDVGADTEVATDRYRQWATNLQDFQQDFLDWVDALTGAGPALFGISDAFNKIAPALQTIALLDLAGFSGLLKTLVTSRLGAIFAGIGVAFALWESGIAGSKEETGGFIDTLDLASKAMQIQIRDWTQGREAAVRYAASIIPGRDLIKESEIAHADHIATMKAFKSELGYNADAWAAYHEKLNEVNRDLAPFEERLPRIEFYHFKLQQIIENYNGTLEDQIALLRQYSDQLATHGQAVLAFVAKLQINRLEVQLQKQALAEWTTSLEQTLQEIFKIPDAIRKTQKEIQKYVNDIAETFEDLHRDLEEAERRHQDRVRQLIQDALYDRQDAYYDYLNDVRDAERDRLRDIEDAHRRHAMRIQDIERDYRRRVLEIEEEYQRTVKQAAIENDALAILRARERRAQELIEAGRDRDENIQDENDDFQESLRQAEQTYQDRLKAAKESYEEELRDIERNLQRRLERERENWEIRKRELHVRAQYEIDVNRQALEQMYRDAVSYVTRINQLRPKFPPRTQPRGPSKRPPTSLGDWDEGFEGMVRGPMTARIGAGVTEYVYASGDLGGGMRQPVMPSTNAIQNQSLRASVSGAVGVGLSGFSERLMGRIGSQLTESVGQAVIDEFADALLGRLR